MELSPVCGISDVGELVGVTVAPTAVHFAYNVISDVTTSFAKSHAVVQAALINHPPKEKPV